MHILPVLPVLMSTLYCHEAQKRAEPGPMCAATGGWSRALDRAVVEPGHCVTMVMACSGPSSLMGRAGALGFRRDSALSSEGLGGTCFITGQQDPRPSEIAASQWHIRHA